MKYFVNPDFDLIKLNIEDIITTSSAETPSTGDDAGGWANLEW